TLNRFERPFGPFTYARARRWREGVIIPTTIETTKFEHRLSTLGLRINMKINYSSSSDIVKEFYFYLGLLSTKFAEMETNVVSLLGSLVTEEVFLINPIIEKNSLSQNIELLKKINLYKEFE